MNKKIKITEKNTKKIEQELKKVNGRLENDLRLSDILVALKSVEKKLLIPKCHMDGVVVRYSPYESWSYGLPQAYKYQPTIVVCNLVYKNSNWYITDIFRDNGKNHKGNNFIITLTPKAEQTILERYRTF